MHDANNSHIFISDQACDPTATADLAAVVMQEGIAHVCLVTSSMTLVRAKIETSIPRKRKGMCAQHDKVCMEIVFIIFIFEWQLQLDLLDLWA